MFRFIMKRLQYRLILAFVLVLLIPTVITAVYYATQSATSIIDLTRVNQSQVVRARAANVETLLTQASADLLFIVQSPSIRRYVNSVGTTDENSTLEDAQKLITAFLSRSANLYKSVCLLDSKGQETTCIEAGSSAPVIADPSRLRDQSGNAFFAKAISLTSMANRQLPVYISSLDLDAVDGEFIKPYVPILRYSTILQTDDGSVNGVITLKAFVAPILASLASANANEQVSLVDENGNFILSPQSDQLYSNILGTNVSLNSTQPNDAKQILAQRSGAVFGSADKPDFLQVFNRIRPPAQSAIQWTVIYQQPLDTIFDSVRQSQVVIIGIAIVSLIAALLIATFLTRSIVQPIRRLASAAALIGQGNLDVQIEPVRSKDEIGDLTNTFRSMTGDLKTSYQNLQHRTDELEIANALATEASRVKSEFLATMSHELRTPLNAMIGFTELMASGASGPLLDKQKHQLSRVHSNSLRLLALIDDVLDLSRIEAGRVDIQNASFSPEEMVSKISAQMSSLADRKGLRFTTRIVDSMPAYIWGDQGRIEHIIINLLSNAFKFTDQGEVELLIKPTDDRQQYTISVRDTGVGIPAHAQEYIFEEFRQVDGSSRRAYGGSGLGLAICRKLCRLMQGDVSVQSAPGKGSTFTITLPLSAAANQSANQNTNENTVAAESIKEPLALGA